jgi:hypothetical protein
MRAGDVVSYLDMCTREGAALQRGMNFRLGADHSVVLMSVRQGAPYQDRIEDDGGTLIYEGHDIPRSSDVPDPKSVDQPLLTPNGTPTQNGLFYRAAEAFRNRESPPERVRVYEKVRQGIWVYAGLFHLIDAWQELAGPRTVCKFKLALIDDADSDDPSATKDLEHTRLIPTEVKLVVWRRDRGKCSKCGATDNLHFDHIIPYSKGGSSLTPENVQLLCARHNLEKRDRLG